jgi:hypothetical protein
MSKFTFPELMAEVVTASSKNKDATVSVGELVEGYAGSSAFKIEQGDFVLSKKGFAQLGDHIGFPSSAIARLDSDPGLQKSVLRHVVADDQDREVNLRVTGDKITHIVSGEHVLLKNVQIMRNIMDLIQGGLLPPMGEIEVGPHHTSGDGRAFSARLLCPTWWNYNVGNGRADIVHGAMYISNSEHGEGAFKCGAALARIACFNWTIGKYEMAMEHRYHSHDEFTNALQATSKLIGGYSEEMAGSLRDARQHHLDRPELVFEKTAERLGIPQWALGSGREYLDQQTDSDNVFDVIQAVTHASKFISDPGGRRRPRWDLRDTVEQSVLQIAQEIILTGEEGFVTTVGDVIETLSEYDPHSEAVGFAPMQTEIRGREVVTNE